MTAARAAAACKYAAAALCLLLAALACASMTAVAAPREFHFEHIDSDAGLAQNTVHVLWQDRTGFMWIATEGGLHRFDGYHLRLYQHDPDRADSLPDNLVVALADAPGGDLWVGTGNGALVRFDPRRGHVTANLGSPADDPIGALQDDSAGRLWVARAKDISVLAPPYDHAEEVYRVAHPLTSLSRTSVTQIVQCPDGGLYAASSDGLIVLDAHGGHVLGTMDVINSLYCDGHGRLFIADGNGFARIDRTSGERHALWSRPADGDALPWAIAGDAEGWLWLGVNNLGLLRMRADDAAAAAVPVQDARDSTSAGADVTRLFIDRSGLLWVGTQGHGAMLTNPAGAAVERIVNHAAGDRSIDSNDVRAIFQDAQGRYWLGTHGAGLERYDPASGSFESHAAALLKSLQLPPTTRLIVYAIAPAAAGSLWLATNYGALHFDPASDQARQLPLGIPVSGPQPIRDVVADADGSLWLASVGHGVLHYRDGFGVIRRYDIADGLPDADVFRIARDAGGRIWAGTLAGLAVLDPVVNRFRAFREDAAQPESLAGTRVTDIRSDADGNLWVGTDAGVNRLLSIDAGGAHFRRYLRRDGLPDTTAYCVLGDEDGNLWISSNLGISRLDPDGGNVQTLGLHDGLQGLEFNSGACLRDHSGALLFGGVHGLNRFRPQDLRASDYLAPTIITGIGFGDINVAAGHAALKIPQDARVLRFDFASLDYAAPARNRFQYRLLGLDQHWIDNGTDNRVTYTNLGPGHYRFEVRGSNHDGVYNPDAASVAFEIVPPWWASRAAKAAAIALGVLALLALALAVRRRQRAARQHRIELQQRDARFRLALWGSGDQFWDWDVRSNILHRLGADQLSGGEPEQHMGVDEWRKHIVHPDDFANVERAAREHFTGLRDIFESEHRILTAGGEYVWVRSRGKIVERDADGEPLRMCGTVHNISGQLSAERERRIAAEVIRSMTEAVAVTDLDFRFVSVNPAFTRMLGYDEREVTGLDAAILNSRQHPVDTYRQMRAALRQHGHWRGELWQRRKDGEEFLSWIELNEVWDADRTRTHYVCVMSDITDRKRAEQELRYLANYDALTGLPNRTFLSERLGYAITLARRSGRKVAVLFIDLDRFKQVNDSMGHTVGDRMLKAAGARLRANVRDNDVVARLGGDEFSVVVEGIEDDNAADRVAQNLIAAFERPLQLEASQEISISPSIGIALFPDHGQTPVDLLKFADTAMYQAKARGRNTWAVYSEAMDAHARRHATLLNALRQALHGNELSVVYQPKLDLQTWEITGVEALLRWRSRSLGDVPPGVFIPLAEEAGLIVDFGEFVLTQACATLAQWRHHDVRNISMAVNISSAQLLDRALPSHLRELLERNHLDAGLLQLELTESLVMTDAEASLRTLRDLKTLGVRLAIDDFGTGYSSFSYLKRLPIDTLKIDKEFIGDITVDPDDEEITTAIISMAHSLGLNVVAEGVESTEQVLYLDEKDCDEIQGHWFSVPLSAFECLALLCRHDPTDRPLPPR